jgi:hypothetical protein
MWCPNMSVLYHILTYPVMWIMSAHLFFYFISHPSPPPLYRWLEQGLQQEVPEDVTSIEELYGLSTITTSHILPTELNTYLYRYEGHLAHMADALGEEEEAASYQTSAENRKYAINSLMWNTSTTRQHNHTINHTIN